MKKKNSILINKKIKKFNKTVKVAKDKSLSLRALMLASQCIGISKIKNLALQWSNIPMLGKTHGQPASTTILGKELLVFYEKL